MTDDNNMVEKRYLLLSCSAESWSRTLSQHLQLSMSDPCLHTLSTVVGQGPPEKDHPTNLPCCRRKARLKQ